MTWSTPTSLENVLVPEVIPPFLPLYPSPAMWGGRGRERRPLFEESVVTSFRKKIRRNKSTNCAPALRVGTYGKSYTEEIRRSSSRNTKVLKAQGEVL